MTFANARQSDGLRLLAAVEGDALTVLAHTHHVETEIGFVALLIEVESDEFAADEVDADRAEHRVEQREPEHVAVDDELMAADRHGEGTRKIPEHDAESAERRNLLEDADEQLQRQRDELVDVLADSLVRVIRIAAQDLQAVVDLVLHPAVEIAVRHPGPPFDLEHLAQVDRVDREDDVEEGQPRELTNEWPERLRLILLQGIVEDVVPAVEADEQVDRREVQADDEGQEPPRLPLLF